jgi:hypothetical protein
MRTLLAAIALCTALATPSHAKTPAEGVPCLAKSECKKDQHCLPIKFGEQSYCVDKDKKCPQRLRWSKTAPESVRGQCYTVPVETVPHEGLDEKDFKNKG